MQTADLQQLNSLKDAENIGKEIAELQEQYKTVVETTQAAWKQLYDEKNRQQETNWEFENPTQMTTENKELIQKLTQELGNLRAQIPKISKTYNYIHVFKKKRLYS